MASLFSVIFFFSSRRRHTRCALVTGVQTCALPIYRRGHYRDRAFPRPPGRSVRTVIKLSCPCHIARLTGHPKRRRRDRTSPGGPCTCFVRSRFSRCPHSRLPPATIRRRPAAAPPISFASAARPPAPPPPNIGSAAVE